MGMLSPGCQLAAWYATVCSASRGDVGTLLCCGLVQSHDSKAGNAPSPLEAEDERKDVLR